MTEHSADTVERVADAYIAGATAVHEEYHREGSLPHYADFSEAANDYAAALSALTVEDAAKVVLDNATIAEKVEMNHAGVAAMFPGGWDISQKIAFDKGRIAALRAIADTPKEDE